MKRATVTPAALAPAALAELKDWLGLTLSADDAQLHALLRAALAACEDATGLVPLAETAEDVLPVASGWTALSAGPVLAITAVAGLPADGSRFALPVSDYAIALDADGAGRVRVHNPGAAGRIAVRYDVGLATGWDSLPDSLRHGVIRLAAHHYRQRESQAPAAAPAPAAVAALWRPWRRVRL